jgi:tetratricopeptide (TPR) repeat protein
MDPGDAAQGSLRIQLEDAAGLMTLELGMPRLSEAHYNNALALGRAQGDRLWTARSLSNLGRLAIHERDPLRAQAAIEESLAIFEELGDRRGVLVATTNMSLVEADLGNLRQSATRMQACVDGWRSMGWNVGIAVALTYLGAVQCAMGDYKAGNASLQEALAITRTIDAPQREVDALINLGIAALHQGRLVLAGKHLDRALALSQELGTRWSEIEAIAARSLLAEITGEAGAEDDARAAEAAARAIGDRLSVAVCLHVLGRAALRRGDLGAAATHIAEGLRQHVEIHNPAGVLLLIETAAELAAVNGDPETAARLFAGADGLRSTLEIPRAPVYHQPTRQAVTIARRRLGKPSFETGWKAGRSLTIDDAAALADRYLASVTGTNDPSESP